MNHKVIKGKRVARVGRIVEELERMKFLQIYLFDKKQKFTHWLDIKLFRGGWPMFYVTFREKYSRSVNYTQATWLNQWLHTLSFNFIPYIWHGFELENCKNNVFWMGEGHTKGMEICKGSGYKPNFQVLSSLLPSPSRSLEFNGAEKGSTKCTKKCLGMTTCKAWEKWRGTSAQNELLLKKVLL